MAEREQSLEDRYEPGDIGGRAQNTRQDYVSDDDIAQMFNTLRERN